MRREKVFWNNIPKHLIDEAEILLRTVLRESSMSFMIQHDVCPGLFDKSLANTTKPDLTWDDLAGMGLQVFVNEQVMIPHGYAFARVKGTGVSPGAIRFTDGKFEYTKQDRLTSMELMAKVGILVEGWNIEYSDH